MSAAFFTVIGVAVLVFLWWGFVVRENLRPRMYSHYAKQIFLEEVAPHTFQVTDRPS